MKKILTWLLILSTLFVLAAVPALADGEDEVWGSYVLSDMDDGSGEDVSEMLAAMAALGMSATLEVREDGSASMDMFGESEEMTFDFDAMTVDANGTVLSFTYEDGVLVFGDGETSFTFTKGGAPALPAADGSFDLFILTEITDGDGAAMDLPAEEAVLTLFGSGRGVLTISGDAMDLTFDLDAMTAEAEGESLTVERSDDRLTLIDGDGVALVFRQEDPGYVGPYVLIAMQSEEEGDLSQELAMMSALGLAPTLTVEEDGTAVMDMFGITTDMVFDFDAMTVVSSDEDGEQTYPFSYAYGRITMEEDGASMVFARVLEEDAAEPAPEEAPAA